MASLSCELTHKMSFFLGSGHMALQPIDNCTGSRHHAFGNCNSRTLCAILIRLQEIGLPYLLPTVLKPVLIILRHGALQSSTLRPEGRQIVVARARKRRTDLTFPCNCQGLATETTGIACLRLLDG
jgi:hypothetical protein